MDFDVGIVGLGYVGLPLALRFAKAGSRVLGFDIDASKVESINDGRSYIGHIASSLVESARSEGRLEASTRFERVREMDAVIVCVPTPLGPHEEPDLSYVLNTARSIGAHLSRGALVCLESTTYPGTTEGVFREILEEASNLKAGVDFHLAYSPEREDPGVESENRGPVPKLVAGLTDACRKRAIERYSSVAERIHAVSSCRIAEASKLLENIFRSVNIALVNELKFI